MKNEASAKGNAATITTLRRRWDRMVSEGQIHYDGRLLQTRVLEPDGGGPAFFLVYNAGRRKYIEAIAGRQGMAACPFCSAAYGSLQLGSQSSLRVLPNTFPCLPHQFVLAPLEHATTLAYGHLKDAIEFAQNTGCKVYANSRGGGSAFAHVVFQASEKHRTAPRRDFIAILRTAPVAQGGQVTAARFDQGVFGAKLTCPDAALSAAIIARLAQEWPWPLNLMFLGADTLLIPRTNVEIPKGFGAWRFGVLEATGTFICQEEATFDRLTYQMLETARREISQGDVAEQSRFMDRVARLVSDALGVNLPGLQRITE